jgi:Tfp pilus assembly protein PilO
MGNIQTIDASIQIIGTYEGIQNFLDASTKTDRLMQFDSISYMEKKDADDRYGTLEATVILKTFYYGLPEHVDQSIIAKPTDAEQ